MGSLCKLEIENGTIISVEPFKSEKELLKTLRRDADVPTINVSIEELSKLLQNNYGIYLNEALNLLNQLARDGMIYSPKENYWKRA